MGVVRPDNARGWGGVPNQPERHGDWRGSACAVAVERDDTLTTWTYGSPKEPQYCKKWLKMNCNLKYLVQ
jgi:hypothetical protein